MTVEVRRAVPEDGPALFLAWARLREHHAALDSRVILAPVPEDEFQAALAGILARGASAAFVAVEDGRLAGFISGAIEANQPDRLPERHATVGYLFVEPAFRRRGIARQLFHAFARWAAGFDGVSHCEMAVLTADGGAAGFLGSQGFTPFIQRLWAPLPAADHTD